MVRPNAGVVSPGCQRAQVSAENHSRKSEDGSDERSRPAPAQIGEFRNGLGEEHLIGVPLKVAENGSAEDGGDDDDAEDGGDDDDAEDGRTHIVIRIRIRPVKQDLAIAVADGAKTF
jgi:hypothetical protein